MDESKQSTRRQWLTTLAGASGIGLAGCSGEEDSTPEGNNSLSNGNVTTGNETSDNESPPSPDDPMDVWEGIDPTGVGAAVDDPDWRMPGHDTANTFTNLHADGPSDDPSVQWVFERTVLPQGSLSWHHPLIVDGTVYTVHYNLPRTDETTVEDGNTELVAIDGETGESETTLVIDEFAPRIAIANDTVYFAGDWEVHSHDLETGDRNWSTSVPILQASTISVVSGTLIVTDNRALTTTDWEPTPELAALDTESGKVLWEAIGNESSTLEPQQPVIADDTVQYPKVTTLQDLYSGDERGDFGTAGHYLSLHDGELYSIGDGYRLLSHSWTTLEERWAYDPVDDPDDGVWAGWPVVVDDTVVVGGSPELDLFMGVDRETGAERWQTNLEESYEPPGPSSLRVANQETVYIIHRGGAVTAIDPADGTIRWQLTDDLEFEISNGCALADDLLVTVGAQGTLYGIS